MDDKSNSSKSNSSKSNFNCIEKCEYNWVNCLNKENDSILCKLREQDCLKRCSI